MFNSRSKEKDRFRDPEDKSTEIIPFEAEEENVRHTDTEHVWHVTKSSNIYICNWSLRRKEDEGRPENFQN